MKRRLLLALAPTWLAATASAATLGGVTLPDTYVVDGRTLALNGIGVRTFTIFRIRIYVAGLYLTRPNHDAADILRSPEPKVVRLRFMHGASKAEVERHYRAGEAANCGKGGCDPADGPDFERLMAAVPAVEAGDTTTFIFSAKGFKVLSNDRLIGEFANPDLAERMLLGFIGDHPPSEALRNALLGLAAS
jgi:hypothetical protein